MIVFNTNNDSILGSSQQFKGKEWFYAHFQQIVEGQGTQFIVKNLNLKKSIGFEIKKIVK